ncbi:MAG: gamma-glutamyl-gamma-aminobutyrate hydrolase family protein [Pseudomonadales bacterium]|nr:gamma-glutamyl-gamma-aminobutyrate hydrolase family protein [Pseudomonadales bacterium]
MSQISLEQALGGEVSGYVVITALDGSRLDQNKVDASGFQNWVRNEILTALEAESLSWVVLHSGILTAEDDEKLHTVLSHAGALLLTGGHDWHNGEPLHLARTQLEERLIATALKIDIPIFAICRGAQGLGQELFGGTIYNISDVDGLDKKLHNQEPQKWEDLQKKFHWVDVLPNTHFTTWLVENAVKYDAEWIRKRENGELQMNVNSMHRQTVTNLRDDAEQFLVAEDGLVEGYTSVVPDSDDLRVLAVQCHPEALPDRHPLKVYFFGQLGRVVQTSVSNLDISPSADGSI